MRIQAGRRFANAAAALFLILTASGCIWNNSETQMPEEAEECVLKYFLSDRNTVIFIDMSEPELQGITRNFKLQKLKLRPIEFAEITPLKITDAETGEPGFLLELHNWHENEDRSITVDAALYYNRSGGEFHHLTLTPNGAEYRITGKNSEIIF